MTRRRGPQFKRLDRSTPGTMGWRIRYLRMRRRLTQRQLGVESGRKTDGKPLSKSFISLIERDRSEASVKTLAAVAAALDTSLDYLVTGRRLQQRGRAPTEEGLAEAYQRLTTEHERLRRHYTQARRRLSSLLRQMSAAVRSARS